MIRWQRSIQPAHFVDLSVNLEYPISNLLSAEVGLTMARASSDIGRRLKCAISGAPARILKRGSYCLRLYVWVRFSVPASWSYPHGTKDQVSIPSSLNGYPSSREWFNSGLIPALSET